MPIFFRVDHAELNHFFHGGSHAVDDGDAGIAGLEDDIGLQEKISMSVDGAHVVVIALGRRAEAMQAIGEFFVHVDDHGIFLR